jgi:hypothetical protein
MLTGATPRAFSRTDRASSAIVGATGSPQLIGSLRPWIQGMSRHRENLTPCSPAMRAGDQRATSPGGLDHDHGLGEARNDAVATGSAARLKPWRQFSDEAAALGNGLCQSGIFLWINAVDTASENPPMCPYPKRLGEQRCRSLRQDPTQ